MVHSNHFFKSQSKHPLLHQSMAMGGFESELNGFLTSTICIAPVKELILSRTSYDFPLRTGSRPQRRGLAPEGRVAKYPKGKPHLNGFSVSTVKIAPLGAFVFDSFRLCATVNLHFLSPFPIIDLSNIAPNLFTEFISVHLRLSPVNSPSTLTLTS
jgi:hypothetical protein